MRYSAAERLFDFGSNLFDFKPRRASNALRATTKVTGNSNCKVKSKGRAAVRQSARASVVSQQTA
jgi:hypothetical protein